MFFLCAWVYCPMLHAQLFTTSSATYRSISNGAMASQPTTSAFRSTSAYSNCNSAVQVASSKFSSTAPMHVSNGSITTIASQLTGGVLADEDDSPTGYIPTRPKRVPGVPDTVPLNDGWDVAILLAILCLSYGIYLRRNATSYEAK
jgi:hypothetical protein